MIKSDTLKMNRCSMKKKIILLLTSIYVITAAPAPAFVVSGATVAVAAGIAVPLIPLIEPLAEKAIKATVSELKKIKIGKCPPNCRKGLPISCGTKHAFSACKKLCQKIEQIGRYEIRVRFEEDWSLAECVRKRVNKGKTTPQGKGNTKSIAVYSQKDLDSLLNLIALRMGAREVVDSNGALLDNNELEKKGITRKKAVQDAKKLIQHIEESIENNVTNGEYGNQ